MSVRRSQNWLNQQRVDVPHLRSIESAVRSDFDELISAFSTGEDQSYIIRGFTLNMVGAIGAAASSLQMIVANSSLFHGNSNISGTFFQVPSGTANEVLSSTTNTRVSGAFTPNTLNYVGIEYTREVDDSTSSQIFIWNPTNKTEVSKNAPLALTMDYQIVITSSIWDSNVLPIAIVETDASNNVVSVQDNRPLFFRLGTGGTSTPDPFYQYPWTEGREENPFVSTTSTSPFEGGDKQIGSHKELIDAMLTEFLTIKGTTFWYSENPAGSLVNLRADLSLLQLTGTGSFSHSATVPGQMNWDSDLFLNFIGSRISYKINSNAATTDITLGDDQVCYVKFVRGVDISPNLVLTNGSAVVSSVGSVSWTSDVLAGDYIKLALDGDTRYFEILSVDSASQVTLTENWDGDSTGSAGAKCQYAFGTYETNAAPSTDRHLRVVDRKDVPFEQDIYWLFLRADNGTTPARIYLRGSNGGELEQGEDREISDNTSLDILTYIGSLGETDDTPNYTDSIVTGVAEVTTITLPPGASLSSGERFHLNAAKDASQFYVDATVDAVDNDPGDADRERLNVQVLSGDTNLQVAAKYAAAIDANGFFNAVDNLDGTVTITNSQVGETTNAVNIDMGGSFAISIDTEGAGSFNFKVIDDENLTRSIKRLDEAVLDLSLATDVDPYEESIDLIAGAPANDRELTAPVAASTSVKIPKNTRNSNIQESYEVNGADLQIFLNGQKLALDDDYTEVDSTNVSFAFDLVEGDIVTFSKTERLGGGSGGDASGLNLGTTQNADVFKQTVGSQLQFRRIAAGTGMTITEEAERIVLASTPTVAASTIRTITTNETILGTDDIILVANSGSDLTATLPDATLFQGKVINIKKIDAGNTLFIKSVLGQTLDGVDIDATPQAVTVQYENTTIVSNGANWFIL